MSYDIPQPQIENKPEPRRSSSFPTLAFILCFLFGLWIIPWIAFPISYSINRGAEKAKMEAAIKVFDELKASGDSVPAWAIAPWVVKKVGSAVVGIETRGTQRSTPRQLGERFSGQPRRGQMELVLGEGSGVIIDKEGYILTNFHVVANADAIAVRLSDGREITDVRLVGHDRTTDLAVLKIAVANISSMEWGNSDETEVGEPVLAIGNPFGLSHTVTQGIISAKERYNAIPDTQMVQEFLQTDAAINPGNSGGPLVNIKGELIGINTAIYGQTYQGIGFAIPSVLAKQIYEKIRKSGGEIKHGYLGVEITPISTWYAEQNNVPAGKGIVIRYVLPNSPADKAQLKQGDIILKWGDHEISTSTQFTHTVILTEPLSDVKLLIVREGKEQEISITVGIRPPN